MNIIFDRTNSDVTYAYKNQNNSNTLIGALNYQDLNRIESNIEYVADLLDSIGYESDLDIKKDWVEEDLPYLDEIDRIRNNLKYLVIKFLSLNYLPQIDGEEYLDYIEVNNWERTIYLLNESFLKYNQQNLYCGEYFCNE